MKASAPVPNRLAATPPKRRVSKPTEDSREPGWLYTKFPNAYDDLIDQKKLCGALERDIIWKLLRHTWGADGRPEWARLSLRQIASMCQGDAANVSRSMARMTTVGLIEASDGKGCSKTIKMYKLTPERWKDAPPYEPSIIALPAMDQAETEAEAEESPEANPGNQPFRGATITVRPGRKAACVPARLMLPDRPPMDFRIQYANRGTAEMAVSASSKADVLLITFGPQEPIGEEKVKVVGKQHPPIENKRLNNFECAIRALLFEHFDTPCDPATVPADLKFQAEIMANAGDDLTADQFFTYSSDEIRTMRKTKRKEPTSGILVAFARQAAKKYAMLASAAPTPQPPTAPPALPQPESIDTARRFDRIKAALKTRISPEAYDNWFRLACQSSEGKNTTIVAVPDAHTAGFIQEEYSELLTAVCAEIGEPSRIVWQVQKS